LRESPIKYSKKGPLYIARGWVWRGLRKKNFEGEKGRITGEKGFYR